MMFLPLSCIKWKESKTSTKTVEPQNSRPQLVVLVIVDQMRADYLDRFKPILLDQSNREVKGLLEFNSESNPKVFVPTNIAPTILDLLGMKDGSAMTGKSVRDKL